MNGSKDYKLVVLDEKEKIMLEEEFKKVIDSMRLPMGTYGEMIRTRYGISPAYQILAKERVWDRIKKNLQVVADRYLENNKE